MTDKKLVKFVTDFRNGMLDGKPSAMCCLMLCLPLVTLLSISGVNGLLMESDLGEMNHVWILLNDGRALDPSADQFFESFGMAPKLPPIYLGPPTTIHGNAKPFSP